MESYVKSCFFTKIVKKVTFCQKIIKNRVFFDFLSIFVQKCLDQGQEERRRPEPPLAKVGYSVPA